MQGQIMLRDGTTLDGCSVSCDGSTLCIYCGLTMSAGADLFLDPARTAEIRYTLGQTVQIYTGYTTAEVLNRVPGGLRVLLSGETTAMETEAVTP